MGKTLGKTLIIGYGNTLRQDDGVGYGMAETVAEWGLPGVTCRSVHQLTPDLALLLVEVEQVIFIDVFRWQGEPGERPSYRVEPVAVGGTRNPVGHSCNPRSILALGRSLFGATCTATWLLIPGQDFGFGETLSPLTIAAQAEALAYLNAILIPDAPS